MKNVAIYDREEKSLTLYDENEMNIFLRTKNCSSKKAGILKSQQIGLI